MNEFKHSVRFYRSHRSGMSWRTRVAFWLIELTHFTKTWNKLPERIRQSLVENRWPGFKY